MYPSEIELTTELAKPFQPFASVISHELTPNVENYATEDSKAEFYTDPSLAFAAKEAKTVSRIPQAILEILQKQEEARTSVDNSVLAKFISQFDFFRMLSQNLGPEVSKHVLKEGRTQLYREGDPVCVFGKKVRKVRILLLGEVGVVFQEDSGFKALPLWDTLQLLVDKLGQETKHFKTKHLPGASKHPPAQLDKSQVLKRESLHKDIDTSNLATIPAQTLLDYPVLTSYEPRHSASLVVTAPHALMLTLELEEFYESLLLLYSLKQNQVLRLFRKAPIFDSFQNNKLKLLVERLKAVQRLKNEYIYREGDNAGRFYLLTEGEVEITKTVGLLAENPNNLYKNRLKVSKEKLDLNIKTLAYANFSGVYNYQSEVKLLRLALLNPISVFGEEELIERTHRQVNARVLSLTASMYQISLQDIQEFCAKISGGQGEKDRKMTVLEFFSLIQESITIKKILFRQSQLSDMVNHANKAKYRLLFQEQGSGDTVAKIRSRSKRRSASGWAPLQKHKASEQEVPPTFNVFNFTDFEGEPAQERQSLSPMVSLQESRILGLAHSKFYDSAQAHKVRNKDKAIRLRHVSRQGRKSTKTATLENLATMDSVSSSNHFRSYQSTEMRNNPKITLQEPLFAMSYFRKQEHLERHLSMAAKKKKLESIYRKSREKQRFI